MSTSIEPNPYAAPLTRCESLIPSMGEEGARCFRVRYWALWRVAIPVSVVALLMAYLPLAYFASGIQGFWEDWSFLAGSVLVMCLVQTVAAHFITVGMPVYVSDHGIRTQNSWGKYRFVLWTEITRVKPSNILGLRTFRIYTNHSRWPLLLPRFVAKPRIFWPFLLTLLPADSPLAKAIREAGPLS